MMVGRKYPFLIANTDRADKGGMHWWSILDISPANGILLMDSFGVFGLKNFIAQNDRKIVERIVKGIEKLDQKDDKLTIVKLRFLAQNYQDLKDIERLPRTFFILSIALPTTLRKTTNNQYLGAGRSHTKNRDFYLWAFPNLLLQQLILTQRKQQATFVQETNSCSR